MIKKLTAVLLTLCICLSGSSLLPAFAASAPKKAVIKVAFDNSDEIADFPVLIKNGNVYCSAEELCSWLGAHFERRNKSDVFSVSIREKKIDFEGRSDDADVRYKKLGTSFSFTLPCKSFINSSGCWVSFSSLLTLMECSNYIDGDCLYVGVPQDTVFDVISRCIEYSGKGIIFDFLTDFGLEDHKLAAATMGGSAALVNVLHGTITGDEGFASLRMIGGSLIGDTIPYDQLYGTVLVKSMATHSMESVEEITDETGATADLMFKLYDVKKLLPATGAKITDLENALSEVVVSAIKGKASVEDCLAAADALENMKQNKKFMEGLKIEGHIMDAAQQIVKIALLYDEFKSRDELTVKSIGAFLDNEPSQRQMNEASYSGIWTEYKMLSGNGFAYVTSNWLMSAAPEYATSLVWDALGVGLLTTAWSFLAENCGVLKENLDMTKQFEIAYYGMKYEYDAFYALVEYCANNSLKKYSDAQWETGRLLAYNYLKSCLITRDAGMASIRSDLDKKPDLKSSLESRQTYIESQLRLLEECNIGCTGEKFDKFKKNHDEKKLIALCGKKDGTTPSNADGQPEDAHNIFYRYVKDNLTVLTSDRFVSGGTQTGVFSALIDDFDSDGKLEMVTASITADEPEAEYVVFDLYTLNGKTVVKSDTSQPYNASGSGNFGNSFCTSYENGKLYVQTATWYWGASARGEENVALTVKDGKFSVERDYHEYEFYRYDQFEYKELVSGKVFDSVEALTAEMTAYGFKEHSHDFDDANLESQLGGSHMFSFINQNDVIIYGILRFMHDNTSLSEHLSALPQKETVIADNGSGVQTNGTTDNYAAAYMGIINELKNKYGEGSIINNYSYRGLSTVRLIDFDKDGDDELFVAYNDGSEGLSTNKYRLYGYSAGNVIELIPETNVYVAGTDYTPFTEFAEKNGKVYILQCPRTESAWFDGTFSTVNGSTMERGFSFVSICDWDEDPDGTWELDGVPSNYNAVQSALNSFYADAVVTRIYYTEEYCEEWSDGEYYSSGINANDLVVTRETIDKLYNLSVGAKRDYSPPSRASITGVTASGCLAAAGERTYVGANTIDGNPDTGWIVNTPKAGAVGAWIMYSFDSRHKVSGLKMINGNVYKDGYYFTNGHLRDFILEFSDGSKITLTAKEIESRSLDSNVFYFDKPVDTSYVKLTVLSSYPAGKEEYRTNTAISEIEFF